MNDFRYINRQYELQVSVGSRVRYTDDGETQARPYHPTWELEVLT